MNDTVRGRDGSAPLLAIATAFAAWRDEAERLVVTLKLLEGVAEFARYWPGRVVLLVADTAHGGVDTNMDHIAWEPARWPFTLEAFTDWERLRERAFEADVVLAFADEHTAGWARQGVRTGVPLVYYTEYSLRTEFQIVDAETSSLPRRLRRKLWLAMREWRRRSAIRIAAGVQCSGTPTFDVYSRLNRNALLFFDCRVRGPELIPSDALERRLAQLDTGRPLRLVFGGRLIPMKGVVELPLVAAGLRELGVRFSLDVFGTGPEEPAMRDSIARLGLQECVFLRGSLDFRSEWIPRLAADFDLFLCCHTQGDPSSTYPEVMSCGLPIAGYANEALAGVVARSGAGWATAIGDPPGLARLVARLDRHREEISTAARLGREFASLHVFEQSFRNRAQHLAALLDAPGAGTPA